MDKRQVIVIHGGESFDTREEYLEWLKAQKIDLNRPKGWKSSLQEALGDNYEIILPGMPNAFNATFEEWSIWFEKHMDVVGNNLILVGHSLGGIFLAKYLSVREIKKNILGTFLVAAPNSADDADYSLTDFALPESLAQFAEQGGHIQLYHSTDDTVVPFSDLARYQRALPYARASVFGDRGHFLQETFPELDEDIRNLG